ncbi:MAG: SH3 domain-containing protein [Anaerolineales bacterium]|nr:SH3 domain-containing protein [Anaerolineales bacterium]
MKQNLREALETLAHAGENKQFLGMALLSLHGVLEEFFRESLSKQLLEFEREKGTNASWFDLVKLWERAFGMSYYHRNEILSKTKKRNDIAHSKPFTISRSEVEAYADFVMGFMGVPATSSPSSSSLSTQATSTPTVQVSSPPQPIAESEPRAVQSRRMSTLILVALVFALGIIYISLNIWNEWEISAGLTAVLFFLLYRRQIWGAIYVYIAGLAYGYLTAILSILTTTATVMTLIWPFYVGRFYLANNSSNVVRFLNTEARTTTAFIETWLPSSNAASPESERNSTFKATTTPIQPTAAVEHTLRIQVQGNSKVRAESNQDAEEIGIAFDGAVYEVLDTTAEKSWYKIRLESGQEGWIGSTRVVEITP